MSAETLQETPRSRFSRKNDRGTHERTRIFDILDAAKVCHVAWVENGRPVCLPTAYGRRGDDLILHGAAKGRFLGALADGRDLCVTVTLVDGLVLARSTFHSSMNYRSVVLFGRAEPITDRDEKLAALDALVEHLAPGRSAEVRPTTEEELDATLVVKLPIAEGAAKARKGPPGDAKADLELPIWAGVVPWTTAAGEPEPAAGCEEMELPPSVVGLATS